MRETLLRWIGDADALQHLVDFRLSGTPASLEYQEGRHDDYYLTLTGELFDRMQAPFESSREWMWLGNALAQLASPSRTTEMAALGIDTSEARLYAATAFYLGGYPASAYVTLRGIAELGERESEHACVDFLARPREPTSGLVHDLTDALVRGDREGISRAAKDAATQAKAALLEGPDEWVPLRLLQQLLERFEISNLRAVLPDGWSPRWRPLVESFVRRGNWDFFPSQIRAIEQGRFDRNESFSIQMPTGAGRPRCAKLCSLPT